MTIACSCGAGFPDQLQFATHRKEGLKHKEEHDLVCSRCGATKLPKILPKDFKGLVMFIGGKYEMVICEECSAYLKDRIKHGCWDPRRR